MPYGLSEKTLEDICVVFRFSPAIESAVLYGSRAKGNFKTGSDIDISLIGEEINLFMLNQVSIALENLNLPQQFDLTIKHQIENKELLAHIERIGIVIYQKNN